MPHFREISIEHLHLDPENPRLPERLKLPNTTESEVLNWMLDDATLVDLAASIAENGFYPGEPIIVISNQNGNYTVIEGNRRLAAVKILSNPELANSSTTTVKNLSEIASEKNHIPSTLWVYEAPSKDDADNYLGFRHITGVKQWPLISKARYLHGLYRKIINDKAYYPEIFKDLAREIGSKGVYVKRLVYGYELFKKIEGRSFYNIDDLSEETFNLSLITDAAVRNANIAAYMGFDFEVPNPVETINEEKLKEVSEWIYKRNGKGDTRLGETRNLPVLNRILGNDRAKRVFVEEGRSLNEAAQFTDLMDESIRSFLNNAYNSLLEGQKITHLSNNPSRDDVILLDDIIASAELIQTQFRKVLRSKQAQEL